MTAEADLVIRGGRVVNAGWSGQADVLISSGRVTGVVEPGTLPPGTGEPHVLDADGKLVMPGGVDPHCHVGFTSGEFTSLDDYRQATTAALFGGTTTIVDFAIPRPGEPPADAAARQQAKAALGLCDAALHGCVVDWDPTVPAQLRDMVSSGIRTVKMYTTYRGETMANEDTILRVMQTLAGLDGMVVIHCEANHIIELAQTESAKRQAIGAASLPATRPELAESASVAEVLAIAESVGAPVYFVHQSTPDVVDLVREARARGVRAWSESVTHHLVLDEGKYGGENPERYACCPPLRPRDTVAGLRRRLAMGQIDTVGSDHCCYDIAQKSVHAHDVRMMPNGLPGVETRLPVLFSEFVATGLITPERFVAVTSANPARLNGLYPRKGVIAAGSDADIIIVDPEPSGAIDIARLHMATDYTPYQGLPVRGRVDTVIVRGRPVIVSGVLIDPEPRGRSLAAEPLFSPAGACG
jgi:dihydropyrimidinase